MFDQCFKLIHVNSIYGIKNVEFFALKYMNIDMNVNLLFMSF